MLAVPTSLHVPFITLVNKYIYMISKNKRLKKWVPLDYKLGVKWITVIDVLNSVAANLFNIYIFLFLLILHLKI